MPPVSQAQRAAMHAAAAGKSTLGIPKSVGQEFARSDPGGKLPERKQEGGQVHLMGGAPTYYDDEPREDYKPGERIWTPRGYLPPRPDWGRPELGPEYGRWGPQPKPMPPLQAGGGLGAYARGGRLASTGKTAEIAAAIRRSSPEIKDPMAAAVATRVKMIGREAVQKKAAAARAGKKYYQAGGDVGLGARPRLQFGGAGGMTGADMPFWTRAAERSIQDVPFSGGLIGSSGAGRTDQLPLAVATESHVIPAAEMAGLGQGNTLAGARLLSMALKVGPWGSTPLPAHHGPGPGQPPPIRIPKPAGDEGEPYVVRQAGGEVEPSEGLRRAEEEDVAARRMLGLASEPRQAGGSSEPEISEGGSKHTTSILAAGGEYVVPREDWLSRDEHGQLILHAGVRSIGEGDIAKGHELLNQMIKNIRNHTIKFLRSAPAPKS